MKKILLILMAMFAFGWQNASAQDAPLKITTHHPDFKIKINRCAASGKTVVIDMQFINQGAEDIDGIAVLTHVEAYNCEAYDNEGNFYDGTIFAYVKGKTDQYGDTYPFSLISGVPINVQMTIEDFSETAESIARFKIRVDCEKWRIGKNKLVKIRNLPITRD